MCVYNTYQRYFFAVPGYYKYEVHNKPPTRPRTYATGYPYYRDPYYRDHYRDPYYRDQNHRAPYYRDQYHRDHYRDPYYRDQYHRYPYYRAKRFNDTITNGTRSNGTIINEAEYNGTKSNLTQSINANNSLRLDEVNDIYEEGDEIGAEYNIEPEITEIKATEKVNFHSTSKSKNYEKVGHTKRVIKIDGLDLMTLLSKLKAENKSYSLHLETY